LTRALRSTSLLLLAAASFLLVAKGTERLIPMPNFLGHWSKWEFYRQHKNDFDALWIGTSHVMRDVDNPAIQARLAERGIELSMFNLGLPGMGTYEQDYMLRRVLALRSERLKYVFIESGPIAMGVHPRHIFRSPDDNDTHRSVMWHTPQETAMVLRQVWLLPVSPLKKVEHVFEHLRILARNLSNYGLGPEIKRGLRGVRVDHDWLVETGGYRTWESTHPREPVHSAPLLPIAEALGEDGLLELEAPDALATHSDLSGLNVGFYAAQYEAATACGVRLVHLTLPGSMVSSERPLLHRLGVIRELWDFNRPEAYPELFRVAHRWDEEHLNSAGVALLTDLLVQRIAELVTTPAPTFSGLPD